MSNQLSSEEAKAKSEYFTKMLLKWAKAMEPTYDPFALPNPYGISPRKREERKRRRTLNNVSLREKARTHE